MESQHITILLQKVKQGEKHHLNDIYALLYSEIKSIALSQIRKLNTGQTITPTVLAHECFIKLSHQNQINIENKRHFLNCLAKSMRQLLVDVVRSKSSLKKHHFKISHDLNAILGQDDIDFKLLEIDLVLDKIERINTLYFELLQYKLIFNLTFAEISEILVKSERHVMRIWKQAKTLLMVLVNEE